MNMWFVNLLSAYLDLCVALFCFSLFLTIKQNNNSANIRKGIKVMNTREKAGKLVQILLS